MPPKLPFSGALGNRVGWMGSAVHGVLRIGPEAPSSGSRAARVGSSCDNSIQVHFRVLAVFVSGDFCCSALASSTGGALCQGYPARPFA